MRTQIGGGHARTHIFLTIYAQRNIYRCMHAYICVQSIICSFTDRIAIYTCVRETDRQTDRQTESERESE